VRAERDPATGQEWRQRAAVDRRGDTPPDPVLDRALEVGAARSGAAFTAFDGNLAGESLPDPAGAAVTSATALESWVRCPHGYFLRYLLRVAPVQQPEEVVRISPADRGTVLHDVLEHLVATAGAQGWTPGPGEPWPERAEAVLADAARTRFARAEAEGITGFAPLWELDRKAMLADLAEWLGRDDERRREFGGLAPLAAEWGFDGVEVGLGDGRAVRLRGRIDRIDRAADGTLVVTDYKTGRADPFRAIAGDPCDRGQRLQLPLYALAARAEFGAGNGTVRAEYWFVTRRGRFDRVGLTLDDAVLERTRLALRTVADGIACGVFLSRARDKTNVLYECPGCDLAGSGDSGVARAWERKGAAAEVAALRALLGAAGTG
jgi:ATP-dependent helicase/nuclease subunit B